MLDVAEKMLECNIDKYIISEVTNLTEKEISWLSREMTVPLEGNTIFIGLLERNLLISGIPSDVERGWLMILIWAMEAAIRGMCDYGMPPTLVAHIAGIPEDVPSLVKHTRKPKPRREVEGREKAIKNLYAGELWDNPSLTDR